MTLDCESCATSTSYGSVELFLLMVEALVSSLDQYHKHSSPCKKNHAHVCETFRSFVPLKIHIVLCREALRPSDIPYQEIYIGFMYMVSVPNVYVIMCFHYTVA